MKEFIKRNKINCIKLLITAFALVLLVFAGFKLWPIFAEMINDTGAFKSKISEMGFSGWLSLLGLQILQIIIAFIPGEPVEILSCVLYGGVGGFLTCELGILIGSVIVFLAVRLLGYSVITSFISEEKLQKYKFLQDTHRLEMLTFILFFIPGTPKDVLTYFVGFTKINPIHFFAIATFARIPSVLTSTLAGSAMIKGDFASTIAIFAVAAVLAVTGLLINDYIMRRHQKRVKH
ncbi:MAG: VTT domain-containing protein [Oscillospiraceae bacterium]